jgi:hypothetical protein
MILLAILILLFMMIISHFIYDILFEEDDEINNKNTRGNIKNRNIHDKEFFYGDRPFRDARYGSYIDPNNLKGSLGNEEVSKPIENKNKIMKMLDNVFKASSTLDNSINPSEERTSDQIFIFHDELEGVKNSNNNKYNGRVWTTTDFLKQLEKDGYSYNNQCSDDYWKKKIIIKGESM